MKKHHFRILSLVLSLSTVAVEASPSTTLGKDPYVSIIENGFGTKTPLALRSKPLSTKRLLLGFTTVHLQLSSSMTLKFDYAALEYKKIRNLERTIQSKSKGFRLGFLVRF